MRIQSLLREDVIVKRSDTGKTDKKAKTKTAQKTSDKKTKTHKTHALVMKALEKEKGEDIVSINLEGKTAIADYMVVVTGTSARHVTSMAQKLKTTLSKDGISTKLEGLAKGDWVIADAGDVIVHFFRAEVRDFYNLEKLWAADFSTSEYTLYQSG